ncbi:MAG: hypothetical protein JGK17_28250 [Microcoleus sp. PH2017_10_PVI_O_A]|uniref:hypothetical protein n=1 Tax=unclassified Microcoleus TaxID=2642155 RepID=UPI001DB23E1B|nr:MULTISPECIES: hypothetical protein [unclassified Microcoleus]MCC3409379.1 hypothetical protein [Microcoleus sp. PH2017_10_PVI_O_A]MCC3463622.1 hypothetical protein [Microcoleus sp. PH2017_11_PCY_U_A]MCC3481970.1 hypothetical protein [Microcoleus sp. PH2017_12_PCY_D_A]MCC3530739.1 hypothetical protein [Microcoleus sp. PH2017_21_RUC_O_A]MCC3543115.1 hypothetical protein [Microcoleus sp. PH2017_22_RUC_O_B]
MNILIEEPEEFNPVDLIRLAQYHDSSLRYRHFAIVFKCELHTIQRWMCGIAKPNKAYRLWAAELKQKWGL